ncbi:MAG: hypothetical protein E7300_02500 [Lachnospiraceae bacterium]|nr:hypothetical protein [Lachnospiraceae bacterium]
MKRAVLLLTACLVFLTAGCSDQFVRDGLDKASLDDLTSSIEEVTDDAIRAAQKIAEDGGKAKGGSAEEAAEAGSTETADASEGQKGTGASLPLHPSVTYYAYSTLDQTHKTVYDEVYACITSHTETTEVSTIDSDVLDTAFEAVLMDHPEIFYTSGYSHEKRKEGNGEWRQFISPVYDYAQEVALDRMERIERKIDGILADAPKEGDDYDTIRYFYEYVITHTDYVSDCPDNQNICSVFLDGQSVCSGYARALQYLLQRSGIEASEVSGNAAGETHAWVLVKSDGDYYYVDPTWGDDSYAGAANIAGFDGTIPEISYSYLLVSTEEISKTHSFRSPVKLPDCTATKDNYYVRENAFFASPDEEKLRALFAKGYSEGRSCVELKCADLATYNYFKEKLLTDQAVFDYLAPDRKNVTYGENPKLFTLTFWL